MIITGISSNSLVNAITQITDVIPTDRFIVWNEKEGMHQRTVNSIRRGTASCVRLMTASGAQIECSADTPFILLNDTSPSCSAVDMLGHKVLVSLTKHASNWEKIISVANIGVQDVIALDFGGAAYAASVHGLNVIFSYDTK